MSAARAKKRPGCMTVLLIFIVVLVLAGVGVWKLVLFKGPGKEGKEIINGPVDPIASESIMEALNTTGIQGAEAVVFPLANSEGNAAIIVLDPANGFDPAPGSTGKKEQAFLTIKSIIEANANSNLNLQRVGLDYQENGKSIVSLTAPMDVLAKLVNGQVGETDFLSAVDVKIKDILYFKELIQK